MWDSTAHFQRVLLFIMQEILCPVLHAGLHYFEKIELGYSIMTLHSKVEVAKYSHMSHGGDITFLYVYLGRVRRQDKFMAFARWPDLVRRS